MMAVIPSTDGQVRYSCKMIFTSYLLWLSVLLHICHHNSIYKNRTINESLVYATFMSVYSWAFWLVHSYLVKFYAWLISYLSLLWPTFSLVTFLFKLSLQLVYKHAWSQVFYFWRDKSGVSCVAQGLKLTTTLHGEVMSMLSLNSFHIKYIVWGWIFTIWQTERKKYMLLSSVMVTHFQMVTYLSLYPPSPFSLVNFRLSCCIM